MNLKNSMESKVWWLYIDTIFPALAGEKVEAPNIRGYIRP